MQTKGWGMTAKRKSMHGKGGSEGGGCKAERRERSIQYIIFGKRSRQVYDFWTEISTSMDDVTVAAELRRWRWKKSANV
jgi:hypothetical protein